MVTLCGICTLVSSFIVSHLCIPDKSTIGFETNARKTCKFGSALTVAARNCGIHILSEMAHGYCAQVELQFRPKLASSTHKSFKIRVKKSESVIADFPLIFSIRL